MAGDKDHRDERRLAVRGKADALDWAAGLGADAVLPKPFAPLDLSAAIEAQLRLAPPPIG